jgi:hypothetical protein
VRDSDYRDCLERLRRSHHLKNGDVFYSPLKGRKQQALRGLWPRNTCYVLRLVTVEHRGGPVLTLKSPSLRAARQAALLSSSRLGGKARGAGQGPPSGRAGWVPPCAWATHAVIVLFQFE